MIHGRTALLIVALMQATLTVRARANDLPESTPWNCSANTLCVISGKLTIERGVPYSAAQIESVTAGCVVVALPASTLKDWSNWSGKNVRATGTALARGDESGGIVWLEYRDRRIATANGCAAHPIVLYVNRIERLSR